MKKLRNSISDSDLINTDEFLVKQLKKAYIFSSLGKDELMEISIFSEKRKFESNEIIYNLGDPGDSLFVIIYGTIHITGSDGAVIAELVSGDCFGELEFLTNKPRNASAMAKMETELIIFPKRGYVFNDVLAKHPFVSARMLFDFLEVIAGRIRNANQLIKGNSPVIQELKRQVYGDKLTGLYNKTFLEEKLEETIKENPSQSLALVMFKPDNFKEINDTFGHETGDIVLKTIANELVHIVNKSFTIFRYKGNEFAILMPFQNRNQALSETEIIRKNLASVDLGAIIHSDSLIHLKSSFGIALYPEHAHMADELILAVCDIPLFGRELGGNVVLFPEDIKGKS